MLEEVHDHNEILLRVETMDRRQQMAAVVHAILLDAGYDPLLTDGNLLDIGSQVRRRFDKLIENEDLILEQLIRSAKALLVLLVAVCARGQAVVVDSLDRYRILHAVVRYILDELQVLRNAVVRHHLTDTEWFDRNNLEELHYTAVIGIQHYVHGLRALAAFECIGLLSLLNIAAKVLANVKHIFEVQEFEVR